ncbi:single-stranded DNA-binding protein [Viridibacillus sp. FSL H7-0596]|uniref:single-stranded DNA-binding protein n=1 Tax=Viridibacillus sp. FSL H7-0596 TaxID=1928923 RepID=UPI00096F36F0|nr:single-stranded DNA-binding protein [Viridibacillus sp. FSL H7-0596]OMC86905.1 single-stranded DNA-binding protein [Viridibacillus sp. FSL H7-0596]
MINRAILVGRLTKDPELRYSQSGVAVARFTLAVNRTFKGNDGEKQADFINIVVWRKQAENTANFLKKGSLAGIEGRIQTGSYEGQDGKRIYTTEVVADSVQFLEPRGAQEGSNGQNTQQQQQNAPQGQYGTNNQQQTRVNDDPFANNAGPIEVSEDDLPF